MEVEFLYFICYFISDGIKMERMDNNFIVQSFFFGIVGLLGIINFGEGIFLQVIVNIGVSILVFLLFSMVVTKQYLYEFSSKLYFIFKYKIMYIKQILFEVGKSLFFEGKLVSSDYLMFFILKFIFMVIILFLILLNEIFQVRCVLIVFIEFDIVYLLLIK